MRHNDFKLLIGFVFFILVGSQSAHAGLVSPNGDQAPQSLICTIPAGFPDQQTNPYGGELQILPITYDLFTIVAVTKKSPDHLEVIPTTLIPLVRCEPSSARESQFSNTCHAVDPQSLELTTVRLTTLLNDAATHILFEINGETTQSWEVPVDQCHLEDNNLPR